MVVGKLLILAATSSSAFANDINNPRFFEYRGGSFINELITVSFGWFKTLSTDQKDAYTQAVTHAVMYAENGREVVWYKGDASGVVVPVMTWLNFFMCLTTHVSLYMKEANNTIFFDYYSN